MILLSATLSNARYVGVIVFIAIVLTKMYPVVKIRRCSPYYECDDSL